MSDTPRTDAEEEKNAEDVYVGGWVMADFARRLERDYNDLMGQIGAMKNRADQYHREATPGSEEADKHLRVFCVLKELERLGHSLRNRHDR